MNMSYKQYYEARDTLLDFLRRDAIGPVCENEVLEEPPLETYVCGILWPKRNEREENDLPESDGEDEEIEESNAETIARTGRYQPSVMALSVTLPEGIDTLAVSFHAAVYSHEERVEEKYRKHLYTRRHLDSGIITVTLKHSLAISLFDDCATLRFFLRRTNADGSRLWTVSAENNMCHSQNQFINNASALFQCQLKLFGSFLPVEFAPSSIGSEDRRMQDMLYRNEHPYAAGHGCSARWEEASPVSWVCSDFMPCATVPQMIASIAENHGQCFRMAFWMETDRTEALSQFRAYLQTYEKWAEQMRLTARCLAPAFQHSAQKVLERINICLTRLYAGTDVLAQNSDAWKAFLLMSEAMMRQSAKKRQQAENEVAWYPFQLCYVIMCISDLVDTRSQWRETVDLLWFPTGGGKTEAYLGVAAFCIFLRRLRENAGGVTVLMRYTLRMLTAQQFERAAALICECERIRRREKLPGGEISIGLWVGSALTPNHVQADTEGVESAERVLRTLREGNVESVTSSPIQLKICPYCGTELDIHRAYQIVDGEFRSHCPNPKCFFHSGLPISTVDDDIYRKRPTLVIGTIDKFARLAWEAKTGAIFSTDGSVPPPSLLIQDELHLISGPLGSISGLYELAIERLCQHNGVGPKIIASTATVCNADGQIRALYGREHFRFPPSGLDADDSFFARKATPEERAERLYIGYCETGGSLADALVRSFGSVAFALRYLQATGTDPAVIDHFWTNVGYFNSLKDLGSADTLILDRANAYAESLRKHKFLEEAQHVQMPAFQAGTYEHGELTSRKSAREITEVRTTLDQVHYPDSGAYSYVLSSNMLSVGIDISRLGLMTVYGQPKTTAEYIQATSRVGRKNPGLVVVLLHMMRARDKGHFERFTAYHQTLNRMVEPTSAAPYACRTMEKALHAVFVILIRHMIPRLRDNSSASLFRAGDPAVQDIRSCILDCIRNRSAETYAYAEDWLDDFIAQWEEEAIRKGTHLLYSLAGQSEASADALLIAAEKADADTFPPTMNSMRNVDTQSNVYLIKRKGKGR